MNIEFKNNNVILHNIDSFNLDQTLDCGQCFRWEKLDEATATKYFNEILPKLTDNFSENQNGNIIAYQGIAFGRALTISQQGETIILHNCSKDDFYTIWYDYFDLATDYNTVRTQLSQLHPVLKEAQQYAPDIRILKQEPWEALCSFIISQNNNIPRIKGIINRLCTEFGEKLSDTHYAFPNAERLSKCSLEDLAPLRSGFRAKYIIDASQKVASKEVDLEAISKLSTADTQKELMKIKGVGPKVADCTMLYGMGKKDCFPLDVWMKRAMEVLFPTLSPTDFGNNAGIAQQYIFHYSRMNPHLFD